MLRRLGSLYEWLLFSKLRASKARILAAASQGAIEEVCQRSRGRLDARMIKCFPTRFDANVFYPRDVSACRALLGLHLNQVTYLACGRLSSVKGWELVLAAFRLLLRELPEAGLVFVGDGEDRARLESLGGDLIRAGRVTLTGKLPAERVALWMNASDALVLGSVIEGWPTVVVEAIACGTRVVATAVSGIRELVQNGQNGIMVMERNAEHFARAMINVLCLENNKQVCSALAGAYSTSCLYNDLTALWPAD